MGEPLQLPGERWITIAGFPGYDVSDFGRVRSYRKRDKDHPHAGIAGWIMADEPHKIMSPSPGGGGYLGVSLQLRGGQHRGIVHRLVMRAFVHECPKGQEVHHKDGDKTNNHLSNLEYRKFQTGVTHAERLRRGQMIAGGFRRKLSDDEVIEMRQARASGEPLRVLTKRYHCHHRVILQVCSGTRHPDVSGPLTGPKKLKCALPEFRRKPKF